ncbi:MAG: hypothetical protein HYR60_29775 [Acidobacteria bacterium]|nr:hypothetical protein [Acidobacteriota bacterium]MBI3470739.1 hypothetical protein [Candidatus Solibacter usitatus]
MQIRTTSNCRPALGSALRPAVPRPGAQVREAASHLAKAVRQKSIDNTAWRLQTGRSPVSRNLEANQELTMINLQDAISQRQTTIQMASSLIKALQDSSGNIVRNLK